MAFAHAEANDRLIAMLDARFADRVRIIRKDVIGHSDDGAPIYVVQLDSPLIGEDMRHVEIVIDGHEIRFKPWRDV